MHCKKGLSAQLLETIKLSVSNGTCNMDKSHVTQSMDSILSTLYNSETLDVLIKSNPIKFAPLFARSLQSIVESLQFCMHELLKEPCLVKVLLKTLRAGYLLSEHLKVINSNSISVNF